MATQKKYPAKPIANESFYVGHFFFLPFDYSVILLLWMSFPYSFLALRYSYLYLHAEYFSPDTFFLPVVDIRRIGMQCIYGRTLRSSSNQMEQRFDGGIMKEFA